MIFVFYIYFILFIYLAKFNFKNMESIYIYIDSKEQQIESPITFVSDIEQSWMVF